MDFFLKFGGLESVITGICDLYPKTVGKHRSIFVLGLVTFCYIAALPTVTYVRITVKYLFYISHFCYVLFINRVVRI